MPADPAVLSAGQLRTALRDFAAGLNLEFKPPSLGSLWRLGEELARRCVRAQGAGLDADIIEASHLALLRVRDQKVPLTSLTVRELRWAPFAFFYPAATPSAWLANDERLVGEYFRWIEEGQNRRALARILRAYVLNYEPSLRTHALFRSRIQDLLNTFDSPSITERRAWVEEHHVLEPDGPRAFARNWLERPSSLLERVDRFGRDGELALSRFMRAVEQVVCSDVTAIGAQLTEEQFRAAVSGLSVAADGGLPHFRDPGTGVAFANAVLQAFASSRRPPERLRMSIRQALVDRLGDPRLPSHFSAWAGVSPRAQQVFKRWLVDDTLRVFFEVISESVQNSPEKKAQWEARRRFWTAYLDDISDAWVALSPSALRVTLNNAAFRDMPHGRMEGSSDNAVLIMAIDDLHLVEFSTVGGVRFWPGARRNADEGNQAPELFKDSYKMADFRVNERFNIPHHDGWETKVRGVIRNETGVRGNH